MAICRECSEGAAFLRDTRPNHPSAQSANGICVADELPRGSVPRMSLATSCYFSRKHRKLGALRKSWNHSDSQPLALPQSHCQEPSKLSRVLSPAQGQRSSRWLLLPGEVAGPQLGSPLQSQSCILLHSRTPRGQARPGPPAQVNVRRPGTSSTGNRPAW